MSIDQNARETCKQRGHETSALESETGWARCKWCGIWRRKVVTFEEREDEPPESEQISFERWKRLEEEH